MGRLSSERGVAEAVERVMPHLKDCTAIAVGTPGDYGLDLWDCCGLLPGLTEVLTKLRWERLDQDSAYRLAELLMFPTSFECDLDSLDDYSESAWAYLRRSAADLLDFVAAIPVAFRSKAFDYLRACLWDLHEWDECGLLLDRYGGLVERLCQEPFQLAGYGHYAIEGFLPIVRGDGTLWERCAKAPDSSWRKFESAAARSNEGRLLARGLGPIASALPLVLADAFWQNPSSLLRAAKVLGTLSKPLRHEVIDTFASRPLLRSEREELGLAELVKVVDDDVSSDMHNPIPKRIREHLSGSRPLGVAQVSRYRDELLHEKWIPLLMDRLRSDALDRLGRGLPEAERDSRVRHALMIQPSVEENRRALRRFLHQYWSGNRRYVEDHPISRRWMATHSAVDFGLWKRGVWRQVELPEVGTVELAVETDPLEVLRLGTYVGSCLGVGGGFTFSAVAAVVDVNKQVVYARDRRGSVVGRQLLGISESEELVCYEVYPTSASKEMRASFRAYDHAFAKAMGLPIHVEDADKTEEDGEDRVVALLAQDFYGDEVWDMSNTSCTGSDDGPGTAT